MSFEKAKSIEAGLHTIVGTEYTESLRQKINKSGQNDEEKEEKPSFIKKVQFLFSNITVEPILFCYILPGIMSVLATQNLSLEKSCRVNLNLGDDICDALSYRNVTHHPTYKLDEENVQALATKMTVIKNIIQSIIPGILLMLLGSWSDRHLRRKPCIIAPVLGDIVMSICLLLCTYFFYALPVEVNCLSEAIPPAITGTWFSMFMGIYSYISDVSSEKDRTLRIGAVNMMTNIAICLGTAISGILYEKLGFYGVYLMSLAFYFVGLLHGMITITDTCNIPMVDKEVQAMPLQKNEKGIINDEKQDIGKVTVPQVGTCGLIRDFFRFKHISNTLTSVSNVGGKGHIRRLYGIIFLFLVIVGPLYGEINVVYFFVRYKFEWDPIEFSYFSMFQFVTNTLGTTFSLMFFTKYLKLDDSVLGMISCSSKVLACMVYAFAPSPMFFYLGALTECLNGTSFIAMRAMITKLVPAEELGKINSLFGVGEALVPLIYGPLYSRIYSYTINKFPGCFYIVGGALTFPAIFIFLWLYTEQKKDKKLEKEVNSKAQKEKLLNGNTKEAEA